MPALSRHYKRHCGYCGLFSQLLPTVREPKYISLHLHTQSHQVKLRTTCLKFIPCPPHPEPHLLLSTIYCLCAQYSLWTTCWTPAVHLLNTRMKKNVLQQYSSSSPAVKTSNEFSQEVAPSRCTKPSYVSISQGRKKYGTNPVNVELHNTLFVKSLLRGHSQL